MYWQALGPALPRGGNFLSRFVGRALLSVMGWRLEGEVPDRPKLIVAVAPHTSNIDFVLTVAVIWGLGLRASFLAKHTLFWFPLGSFMRVMGGIAVDRRSPQGLVQQMASEFDRRSKLVLGITPQGTRSKDGQLKPGFALIAQAANVPVLPAIIDLNAKVVRFEPLMPDVSDAARVVEAVTAMAEAATTAPQAR